MSSCGNQIIYSPANQACCPNPETIVTENCQDLVNIADTPVTTIWSSATNQYMSFTFFVNPEETSSASIIVTNNGVAQPVIIVQPGTSVTRTFRGVTLITVAATDAGETTGGRFCYKLYKQVTL